MADVKRQRRAGGGRGGDERRSGGGGRGRGRGGGGGGDDGGGERQGFTAFNMEDENDEGHFDENGNFIWKKEEKSVQEEAWLDIVSEEQIEAAKSAKDRKDFRDEQEDENMTEDQANAMLASLLQPRETVLQALQRLGKKRSKPRGSNKRKQAGEDSTNGAAGQTAEEKEKFERITEAADYLMRIGEVDVYSQMKEEFMSEDELLAQRQQRKEEQEQEQQQQQQQQQQAAAASRASYFGGASAAGNEAKSSEPTKDAEVMWEYKGADGEIHGPFPTSTLVAWRQHGYFVGDNAVDMRIVISEQHDQPAQKDDAKDDDKPTISAEEELLNDFEDSDDDDANETTASVEVEWMRSDQIDFQKY